MSFDKKFKRHNEEEAREALAKKAEELSGGSSEGAARVRLKDGLNVLWVLPKVGTMIEPYIYKYVHYNPFHICSRKDPVPDPKDPTNLLEDKNFRNCARDIEAWNRYVAAGKPKSGPEKDMLSRNMPSLQCLVQVVNLTPFFTLDATKNFAVPNKEALKSWGEAFVKVLKGGEVPEGMPSDMEEAARAGVSILFLNQSVGKDLRQEHIVKCIELEDDPLFMPDEYLVQIIRKDGSQTFESNGKTIKQKEHSLKFTLPAKMKGWAMPAGLIDAAADSAVDINAIESETNSLADRVKSLHKLDHDELLQFLRESGHSFESANANQEPVKETPAKSSLSSSPDDFEDDDDVLPTNSKKDLAALRRQLQDEDDD
jgi:hypothetical protein